MKKTFITLLLGLSCFAANAQKDYSKEITKKVDDLKNITTFTTPAGIPVSIFKAIIPNSITQTSAIFNTTQSFFHLDLSGLYIKLENGEILRYPDIKLHCNVIGLSQYLYTAELILTDELYNKFSKNKIVEFSLDDYKQSLNKKEADRVMFYVKNIYDAQ